MNPPTDIKHRIAEYFKDTPGLIAIYLFGSVLQKTGSAVEDIDIAVLYRREAVPDYFEITRQKEDLAALLHTEVDLVVLNMASPILVRQVFKKGRPVFIADETALNRFIVRVMNVYADLKRVRRPIENNLHNIRLFHD